MFTIRSRDISVGIVTSYGMDEVARDFVYCTAFRLAPGTTQPPTEWGLGALSSGAKRRRRESEHSLPPTSEVKNG
jgi:hypothetical protein